MAPNSEQKGPPASVAARFPGAKANVPVPLLAGSLALRLVALAVLVVLGLITKGAREQKLCFFLAFVVGAQAVLRGRDLWVALRR